MRPTDDIMHVAVNLKLKLQKRSRKLLDLHTTLAHYDAGLAPHIKLDRIETMRVEVDKAAAKQAREGLIYATLRWVVGGSEEIDDDNLDLE